MNKVPESQDPVKEPPLGFQAAIFDMDGVITRTASLHAAAWKELFDDLLRRTTPAGQTYRPFDERGEYRAYVDGKPRMEGVRSFLRARQLTLPESQVESSRATRTRCSRGDCRSRASKPSTPRLPSCVNCAGAA